MLFYFAIIASFYSFHFLTLELEISSEEVSVNFCAHEANTGENTSYFLRYCSLWVEFCGDFSCFLLIEMSLK